MEGMVKTIPGKGNVFVPDPGINPTISDVPIRDPHPNPLVSTTRKPQTQPSMKGDWDITPYFEPVKDSSGNVTGSKIQFLKGFDEYNRPVITGIKGPGNVPDMSLHYPIGKGAVTGKEGYRVYDTYQKLADFAKTQGHELPSSIDLQSNLTKSTIPGMADKIGEYVVPQSKTGPVGFVKNPSQNLGMRVIGSDTSVSRSNFVPFGDPTPRSTTPSKVATTVLDPVSAATSAVTKQASKVAPNFSVKPVSTSSLASGAAYLGAGTVGGIIGSTIVEPAAEKLGVFDAVEKGSKKAFSKMPDWAVKASDMALGAAQVALDPIGSAFSAGIDIRSKQEDRMRKSGMSEDDIAYSLSGAIQ